MEVASRVVDNAEERGGPGGNPTGQRVLDRSLDELRARRTEWARLPVREKIALLQRTRTAVAANAERWVRESTSAKGIYFDTPLAVEDWLAGPWAVLFAINRYIETLEDVAEGRPPRLPKDAIRARPDGQLVVRVFPHNWYDRVILSGITADVWMERGVTKAQLPSTMAVFYRQHEPQGALALVLGAGNIHAIAPLDVLSKLLVEGHVCVLKLNPVNDYLGPVFEDAFEPLIERGYLRLVYGGADVGERLCLDPRVEEIHVTGSEATFEAILFGPGAEGAARKARNEPRIHKRLTGELGNVSPTIVFPGRWSDADLRFHAMNVATQKLLNVGFNCVASQVLVLPRSWPQADTFLGYVRQALSRAPDRPAYYPGAGARLRAILSRHPTADVWPYGGGIRALVSGLHHEADHDLFTTEAFGPVLAETRLPGHDLRSYTDIAVRFANERLRGTLGINLIIHPHTERLLGSTFEDAVAHLRYGCTAINVWSAAGFLMASGTWGAFPGHTHADIQSGVGVVHNARMFSRPERTVVRGPFQPFPRGVVRGDFSLLPTPPWFLTHRRAHEVTRRLVAFEASPRMRALPGIIYHAVRG